MIPEPRAVSNVLSQPEPLKVNTVRTSEDRITSGGDTSDLADRAAANRVELYVGGMTCASCAARIEKKLNRLDGVSATVNYATGKATVSLPATVSVDALIAAIHQAGYSAAPAAAPDGQLSIAGGRTRFDPALAARRRLRLCALLSVPVVAMAMVTDLRFPNWQWLSLTLATPVVFWAGLPLHRAAWKNLRHATATMDTLISLGTLAAFGWSVFALFSGAGDIYFEVAAGVTTFILTGRYLEARAKHQAGSALRALMDLGAKDVLVLRSAPGGGSAETKHRVPIAVLTVGDRFVVRPGEKIATDGVVERGRSSVDVSMLTGEPTPVDVSPGNTVAGGCVNRGGELVVRATKVGADTQLARIAALVEVAQSGKAAVQRLADRAAAVFVPGVMALAGATFLCWFVVVDQPVKAFSASIAVLIIACPCALGLATPTALLVGTGRGAQLGILIKGPDVLESTRRLGTVVLDKTGTITSGQMKLVNVIPAPDEQWPRVLQLAGALEQASEHPIARAIVDGARKQVATLAEVEDFHSSEGLGVRGVVGGRTVVVGRAAFLADHAMPVPVSLRSAAMAAEAAGHTAVLVGWSGQARGLLVVADQIKASSGEAVRHLRALGLNPILLSGDNVSAANTVARAVGITQVIAEVRPEEKVTVIRQLQARGEAVAMVGDGVNDAAALAEADLGLAMGTGTDAAIEAAPITLVRGDLCAAADAIRLARSTLKIIKANLFWAFAYNVISLPVAAAGLLEPMIAGATMAFSSVFVVTNSLRLRRFAPLPAVPLVAAFSSSRTPPTAMPASTVPPAEPVARQPVEPAASTVRIPRQRTASQPRPFMPNRCGYPQRATKKATVNAGGKHRRPGSQPPSVRQPMPGRSAW